MADKVLAAVEMAADSPRYPIYLLPIANINKLNNIMTHEEAIDNELLVKANVIGEGRFSAVAVHSDYSEGDEVGTGSGDNCLCVTFDKTAENMSVEDKVHGLKRVIEQQDQIWKDMGDFEKPTFVWTQELCIPQRDNTKRPDAIVSFAAYGKFCNKVICVVKDKNGMEDTANQAWARLEVLAAFTPRIYDNKHIAPRNQRVFLISKDRAYSHFADFDAKRLFNPLEGKMSDDTETERNVITALIKHYIGEFERYNEMSPKMKVLDEGTTFEIIPEEIIHKMKTWV